ncbi:unnamed protein product, partial [Urochloa humidicola]
QGAATSSARPPVTTELRPFVGRSPQAPLRPSPAAPCRPPAQRDPVRTHLPLELCRPRPPRRLRAPCRLRLPFFRVAAAHTATFLPRHRVCHCAVLQPAAPNRALLRPRAPAASLPPSVASSNPWKFNSNFPSPHSQSSIRAGTARGLHRLHARGEREKASTDSAGRALGRAVDPAAGWCSHSYACGASCGRRGEASCELWPSGRGQRRVVAFGARPATSYGGQCYRVGCGSGGRPSGRGASPTAVAVGEVHLRRAAGGRVAPPAPVVAESTSPPPKWTCRHWIPIQKTKEQNGSSSPDGTPYNFKSPTTSPSVQRTTISVDS